MGKGRRQTRWPAVTAAKRRGDGWLGSREAAGVVRHGGY